MKKIIKFISHKQKWQSSNSFYALGYPRSGTTMLSHLINYSTDYSFDKDNIFPISSKRILHTHWLKPNLPSDRHIYIIRNPFDVSKSIFEYCRKKNINYDINSLLNNKNLVKYSWKEHVEFALKNKMNVVFYDDLVNLDSNAIHYISRKLGVSYDVVLSSLTLLKQRHKKTIAEKKSNKNELIQISKCDMQFYEELYDKYKY